MSCANGMIKGYKIKIVKKIKYINKMGPLL